MPNYDMYNTDPYFRFLNWRNSQQGGGLKPQSSITNDYLGRDNILASRGLGNQPSNLTPDTTGQSNWQTGSNILTPQNAGQQGMTQVGNGKYVSNSLAKYYNQGGQEGVSVPLQSQVTGSNINTQMGPPKPTIWQGIKQNVTNAWRGSESTSPNTFSGKMARFGGGGESGAITPVQGGGGMAGYLGAANAIMGMFNKGSGGSQPVVSQPIMVNNPPPIGGSFSREEPRNRLASLPQFRANGGVAGTGVPYIVGEKGPELFIPEQDGYVVPNNVLADKYNYLKNNIPYDKNEYKSYLREPYQSENKFFQKRPEVAGMATEDKKVILNPYNNFNEQQRDAVNKLEYYRLKMYEKGLNPNFGLTDTQKRFLENTEYKNDPVSAKQSIISRILVGDPSAQDITPEQIDYANKFKNEVEGIISPENAPFYLRGLPKRQLGGSVVGGGATEEDFPGMIQPGNIDISNRPRVLNNGKTSTVRSIGVNMDGKEMLIPTVSEDGRIMSNDEAVEQYKATGRNLGSFSSPEASTHYAESLHRDQAQRLQASDNAINKIANNNTPIAPTPEQNKPSWLSRIFKQEQQPKFDMATPEGQKNYLNYITQESIRKPTFSEKLPQALALMSGAFDPHGDYARSNANVLNMAQQQEQERRQAPVNYLNQLVARSQIEGIPLERQLLQAQIQKALQPESPTKQTPFSVFYAGQKAAKPEKTDLEINKDWVEQQKEIQGQYKPSEYLTFYEGYKQDNPKARDSDITKAWVEHNQKKGLNVYQTAQAAHTLREEVKNNPYVKEFRDINSKFSVMGEAFEESKKTKNHLASDQAMITLFNKMTDPDSVVRESEYARTPKDQALMNRLKGKIQAMQYGGPGLTDDDRQAIYNMASKFYDVYSKNYNDVVNSYKELATASGIKENLVGIPFPIPVKNEPALEDRSTQAINSPKKMTYNPTTGEIE
ncbi:MAG: hypothetical protein [Podoviridae sp. cty5g4]|nr:MAG: hypothetical protein [Podoviridae sp. cty5g4]